MSFNERIAEQKVLPGQVAIYWLSQGGFAFKTAGGQVIFVDPYLTNSCGTRGGAQRLVPPPVLPAEARPDLVLCTHDHQDHVDPETIAPLAAASPATVFGGPDSCCRHMAGLGVPAERLLPVNRGQRVEWRGTTIHGVHAYHTEDSVGLVFDFAGPRVYITGDSEFGDELFGAAALKPDVLIVCINGRWGNMSAAQAAKLAAVVQPKVTIPMHYGLFAENTADPQTYVDALRAEGVAARPVVLDHQNLGQPYLYSGE